MRVTQEGIYNNKLSHRKTRYWATLLYCTLIRTILASTMDTGTQLGLIEKIVSFFRMGLEELGGTGATIATKNQQKSTTIKQKRVKMTYYRRGIRQKRGPRDQLRGLQDTLQSNFHISQIQFRLELIHFFDNIADILHNFI
jgi:hypothetical protein